MRDTPITDALLESLKLGYRHKENALIEHAKELERELAILSDLANHYRSECDRLRDILP